MEDSSSDAVSRVAKDLFNQALSLQNVRKPVRAPVLSEGRSAGAEGTDRGFAQRGRQFEAAEWGIQDQ